MIKAENHGDIDKLVIDARTESGALGRLYGLYYGRIFRFCVHRLFNREAAQDVTSQVFLAVARRIKDFDGKSEDEFCKWVFTIAANYANTYIRKATRRKKLLAEVATSRLKLSTEASERQNVIDWPVVYGAILKLKRQDQTIVTLRYFENMSFADIGGILDIKETTARVKLHRAIKELRKHLNGI